MQINDFIENFTDQFENTEKSVFTAQTKFRDLDEWNSLIALSVMAMVDEEYDIKLKGDDMRNSNTIQDLYDVVKSQM
jgi:acyl carrier protein